MFLVALFVPIFAFGQVNTDSLPPVPSGWIIKEHLGMGVVGKTAFDFQAYVSDDQRGKTMPVSELRKEVLGTRVEYKLREHRNGKVDTLRVDTIVAPLGRPLNAAYAQHIARTPGDVPEEFKIGTAEKPVYVFFLGTIFLNPQGEEYVYAGMWDASRKRFVLARPYPLKGMASEYNVAGLASAKPKDVIPTDAAYVVDSTAYYSEWVLDKHLMTPHPLRWDTARVGLFVMDEQLRGEKIELWRLIFHSMVQRGASGYEPLNASVLDYLLANQSEIPAAWKTPEGEKALYVVFPSSLFVNHRGGLSVRCLVYERPNGRGWMEYPIEIVKLVSLETRIAVASRDLLK